jgi:hypothetical protein
VKTFIPSTAEGPDEDSHFHQSWKMSSVRDLENINFSIREGPEKISIQKRTRDTSKSMQEESEDLHQHPIQLQHSQGANKLVCFHF